MEKDSYEDIIDLPRPVSRNHTPMPMYKRAAQFSPFAALTGYEELIRDTERVTEPKKILSEDKLAELDRKFQSLSACIPGQSRITITYFVSDKKKDGGQYVIDSGIFLKMENDGIVLEEIGKILFSDISDIAMEEQGGQ